MRNITTTPIKPIQAPSIASKIEELEQSIKSLKAVIETLCELPDYLVAEEYNAEVFDTICELQTVIFFLKKSQLSKAA
ncbi:hypothetical protein [Sphingobacterium psychroaquaticum]|uniref:Uncharacterized protein n=1 Tax=Sphingobacterium psychroaquaticum TaxID=561061 RepID=A0A1X7JW35_9SPHI|nr:hypothetical protein [Sphingobacterium psychroaquaticum]SMG31932.1 hypothetical protein SAMN05660862_2223 [Sphingobacterium psychroaquaticum]